MEEYMGRGLGNAKKYLQHHAGVREVGDGDGCYLSIRIE